MIYYILLILYIIIVNLISNLVYKNSIKRKKMFIVLSCIGVVLFQGFRAFNVGIDLGIYIPAYSNIGNQGFLNLTYQNFEIGYVLLNKILYYVSLNERQFLIIISCIIQIPIFISIYRHSESPLFSILWYFCFGNFLMTFSGLRQSIAMAICFLSYTYIIKHQKFKFLFLILLASSFHKSALFCIILYPLYYIKLDRKKLFFALAFILFVYLFKEKIFQILVSIYYGHSIDTNGTGAYTMFLVYLVMFVLSFHKNDNDKNYLGLRNILFLLVIIYSFSSIHNYFTRIGYPLTLFMTIFMPKFINSFNVKQKNVVYLIIYCLLIVYFCSILGNLNTLPFSFSN